MPLPVLFIGIAALTGVTGVGATVKGGFEQSKARNVTNEANLQIEIAAKRLEYARKNCGDALKNLGEEKMFILNNGIHTFLESFTKIKNVDFRESEGLLELKKLKLEQADFKELAEMTKYSFSVMQGSAAGVASGAATAFGAYGLATTFATASTGTAISSLSGAAATNATLAFFGGGSLATGGLGVAGGTMVLGGLVAGPALLVLGLVTGAKAGKNLNEAYANAAKAEEVSAELDLGSKECIAIRRRCNMYYNLLARLDSYLLPLQYKMDQIIEEEGVDYSTYSIDSKKTIAAIVSTVASIKAVLDTPILTEEGLLTEESHKLLEEYKEK